MCAPRAVRPRRRGPLGHPYLQPPLRGREAPPLRPTCWPPASWRICEAGREAPPQPVPRGAPHRSPPLRPLPLRLRAAPPAPPRAIAVPFQAAPKPITSLRTSSHTCGRTQVSPSFLAPVGFRERIREFSGTPSPHLTGNPETAWRVGGGEGGAPGPQPPRRPGGRGFGGWGTRGGAWRPRGRAARVGRSWWPMLR